LRDTEHDELEHLLGLVRHEDISGGYMVPVGKNLYATGDHDGLDDNFMENYELWLHEEVFGHHKADEDIAESDEEEFNRELAALSLGGTDTTWNTSLTDVAEGSSTHEIKKGWWAPTMHKVGHMSLDMGMLQWETEWPESIDLMRQKPASRSAPSSESGYQSGSMPDDETSFDGPDEMVDDGDVDYSITMSDYDEPAPPTVANGVTPPAPSPAGSPLRRDFY
jgi:hypothetical protein